MRYVADCPHCGARIDLPIPPRALVVCAACSGSGMAVLPEHADEAEEVHVRVLPRKEKPVLEGALERHGLRRPLLLALLANGVLVVALVAAGVSLSVAPDSEVTRTAVWTSALGLLWLAVGLPLSAAFAFLVLRFVFRRERRTVPGLTLGRPVVAVVSGVATLVAAGLVVHASRALVFERDPSSAAYWSLSVLCDAAAGVLAGAVTVRLAPMSPYRHVASVGIVLVLLVFLLAIPLVQVAWYAPLAALAFLVFVPPLLLGAWLAVRFGRRTGASPASS